MTAIVGATLQLNKLAVLDGAPQFAQTSGNKSAFLVPFALFKAAATCSWAASRTAAGAARRAFRERRGPRSAGDGARGQGGR